MRLYGAKVSQEYIQLPEGAKKLKHRYPDSEKYPYRKDNFDNIRYIRSNYERTSRALHAVY